LLQLITDDVGHMRNIDNEPINEDELTHVIDDDVDQVIMVLTT